MCAMRHSSRDGGVRAAQLQVRGIFGTRATRVVRLAGGVLSIRDRRSDEAAGAHGALLEVRVSECYGGVVADRRRLRISLVDAAGKCVVTLLFKAAVSAGDADYEDWLRALQIAHECRLDNFYIVNMRTKAPKLESLSRTTPAVLTPSHKLQQERQRHGHSSQLLQHSEQPRSQKTSLSIDHPCAVDHTQQSQSTFVPPPDNLVQDLPLGLIGKGHYAKVFRAIHRETGQLVAVKAISKSAPQDTAKSFPKPSSDPTLSATSLCDSDSSPCDVKHRLNQHLTKRLRNNGNPENKKKKNVDHGNNRNKASPIHVQREAEIMRMISHSNVVRCLDVFETSHTLYVVMELAPNGTLADIFDASNLDEDAARVVVKQILSAVVYLHDSGVIHRDIKPENILVSADGALKLADFGLSRTMEGFYPDEYCLSSVLGTPSYVAPEIASKRHYGLPVDCWSVGIILHMALTGRFPFKAKSPEAVFHALKHSRKIPFPRARWACISPAARDLVRGLLAFNPDHRLTAREALVHPWLAGATSLHPDAARVSSLLSTSSSVTCSAHVASRSQPQVPHGKLNVGAHSEIGHDTVASVRKSCPPIQISRWMDQSNSPSLSPATLSPCESPCPSPLSRMAREQLPPSPSPSSSSSGAMGGSQISHVSSSSGTTEKSHHGMDGVVSRPHVPAPRHMTRVTSASGLPAPKAISPLVQHPSTRVHSFRRTPSHSLRSLALYRNSSRMRRG